MAKLLLGKLLCLLHGKSVDGEVAVGENQSLGKLLLGKFAFEEINVGEIVSGKLGNCDQGSGAGEIT